MEKTKINDYKIENGKLTIKNVSPDCPILYDNDWFLDIVDNFYIYAKASMGEADLRGIIASRDMWPGPGEPYTYKLKQSIEDGKKSIEMARNSGLKNIPDLTIGAGERLIKPESGKIEDTKIVRTPGSDLIVEEARKASPEKPLIVYIGGPFTTVANAYLTEPDIAENMVVFGITSGYNDKDQWACYVVCKQLKFGLWGRNYFWPKGEVLPAKEFDSLPDNEVCNFMKKFMRKDLGIANQLGDGAWITWLYDNRCFNDVNKYLVENEPINGEIVTDDNYDILSIPEEGSDFKFMREEFFSTLRTNKLWD